MKKIGLTILLIIVSEILVFSQYFRINLEHLSVTEGLSQSSILSITQDKNSFMWFATLDGLNKYDGYEIKTYYSDTTSGTLPDNVITSVYTTPDEQEDLWIGTADHGICLYDPIFDKFINFSNNKDPKTLINDHITVISGNSNNLWIGTQKGLTNYKPKQQKWTSFLFDKTQIESNHITCILTDKEQNVWVGTQNGLFIIKPSTNSYSKIEDNLFSSKNITALTADKVGNIWIGTKNGLLLYNFIQKKFITEQNLEKIPDKTITAIMCDFENIIWIGTEQAGLIRYDPTTKQTLNLINSPTNHNSLSTNNILTIYEDKNNLIWIGTSLGGVDKWNRAAQNLLVFRHNPYNENSLSSSKVRSIFEDQNKTIWIGTVDGGLNKWSTKTQSFRHVPLVTKDKNNKSDKHIRAIFEDSKKRFWIGTAHSGAHILNKKNLKIEKSFYHKNDDSTTITNNNIWRIAEDNAGNILLATYGGGLNIISNENQIYNYTHNPNDSQSICNNWCTTILCDNKNRIWIGTNDGLNIFNPKTKKFTVFKHNPSTPNSLSNNRIYSIYQTMDNTIWIGTKGGLNKYLENGTFETFTVQSHDLINNVIMGILEDTQKNLWLATNQGLCKFNPTTYNSRTYDVKDGLQSNEFLVGSYFLTEDKMFIVGGINGFNAFYPEKIKDNPNLPTVIITNLMISNENVKLDTIISEKKSLNLTHQQNDLTFKFVAIDYILPEKNQYAYMLEGYDNDWIYCKYQRSAKYTNLPPGHYIFKVKGSNNDLIWNEKGTEIPIYIKPAIWQRTSTKIIGIIVLILIILLMIKLRLRHLEQQRQYLEQEVNRQTNEIRLQKEEIESQRDEIDAQRQNAIEQRDLIAVHKKEIEDSILYAKKIQTAALPENKIISMMFEDFFILFKPRDIVSGDFYWAFPKNNKLIVAAADCTGHGVPGAFMSMLGISFLNKIVNEKGITEPHKILNRLRTNIITALKQTIDGQSKDGMDITICSIDKKNHKIDFAAANNQLYLIRDGKLTAYKAQKMPIAIFENMKSFEKQTIDYHNGDKIYLFSDGYADQFGGTKGKKFRYSNLKKMLEKSSSENMSKQKEILTETLNKWMDYPDPYTNKKTFQVDDIIIFGIQL